MKLLSIVFLFIILGLILLILYWYFRSDIRDPYIRNLIIILTTLYAIVLLTELIIVPIVLYLVYSDLSFIESVKKSSSIYQLHKHGPILAILAGFSYITYFFSLISIMIISNKIKEHARINGYQHIYEQMTVIGSISRALFIVFVILFLILFIIKGVDFLQND